MKFCQLRLAGATYRAMLRPDKSIDGSENPSGEDQIVFARRVMLAYSELWSTVRFPYDVDDVSRLRLQIRKAPNLRLKCQLALLYPHRCFWEGRGAGPCCEIVEAGHLIPASKGGPNCAENMILECRSHNNDRRARLIEEYLRNFLAMGEPQ